MPFLQPAVSQPCSGQWPRPSHLGLSRVEKVTHGSLPHGLSDGVGPDRCSFCGLPSSAQVNLPDNLMQPQSSGEKPWASLSHPKRPNHGAFPRLLTLDCHGREVHGTAIATLHVHVVPLAQGLLGVLSFHWSYLHTDTQSLQRETNSRPLQRGWDCPEASLPGCDREGHPLGLGPGWGDRSEGVFYPVLCSVSLYPKEVCLMAQSLCSIYFLHHSPHKL